MREKNKIEKANRNVGKSVIAHLQQSSINGFVEIYNETREIVRQTESGERFVICGQ